MPYIKDRQKIRTGKNSEFTENPILMLNKVIDTEGDLNYVITQLCTDYLYRKGECYATYNTLIGVLECAKLEFYRKKVAFYEDKKEQENGPIITNEKI